MKRVRILGNLLREACVGLLLLGMVSCASPKRGTKHDLVNVEKMIPGVRLDIRYATTNNFTGKVLYPMAKCYLRREPAEHLKEVQAELQELGFGLKIFDGYRPLSVQKKMWAIFPNDNFVANPAKGSRHNRGAAVDLTLIRLDGKELEMPTPYDDFTEKAHRKYMKLPGQVLRNRQLLEDVMTSHGFRGLDTEWWHFDYQGAMKYEILDVDYAELR
jgi:D-alanyl-D-alanine dipeptidase